MNYYDLWLGTGIFCAQTSKFHGEFRPSKVEIRIERLKYWNWSLKILTGFLCSLLKCFKWFAIHYDTEFGAISTKNEYSSWTQASSLLKYRAPRIKYLRSYACRCSSNFPKNFLFFLHFAENFCPCLWPVWVNINNSHA